MRGNRRVYIYKDGEHIDTTETIKEATAKYGHAEKTLKNPMNKTNKGLTFAYEPLSDDITEYLRKPKDRSKNRPKMHIEAPSKTRYKKIGNTYHEIDQRNQDVFHHPRGKEAKKEVLLKLFISELSKSHPSNIYHLKKEYFIETLKKL